MTPEKRARQLWLDIIGSVVHVIELAIKEEREECAKIADDVSKKATHAFVSAGAKDVAEAIRERGKRNQV